MGNKYYDDYEGSSFEKFTHRKPKNRKKGHQSRSKNSEKYQWARLVDNTEDDINEITIPVSTPTTTLTTTPPKTEHQFGEHTHEIKGVKIDFDGVADIQKVDNIRDNVVTYGIKFLFKGKKGLYRIIWYNTNMRARDAAYNTEYGFWLTINK